MSAIYLVMALNEPIAVDLKDFETWIERRSGFRVVERSGNRTYGLIWRVGDSSRWLEGSIRADGSALAIDTGSDLEWMAELVFDFLVLVPPDRDMIIYHEEMGWMLHIRDYPDSHALEAAVSQANWA